MAWLRQIDSDYEAGPLLYLPNDHQTYCHAIAKYQQVAEKSVKAMVAALSEKGFLSIGTGARHDPDKLLSALLRLPNAKRSQHVRNAQHHVLHILNDFRRGEIRAVCALAPKMPAPGQLRRKNTEYPYHNKDETWRAPADDGSFSRDEVERFRRLADTLRIDTRKFISAVRRGFS